MGSVIGCKSIEKFALVKLNGGFEIVLQALVSNLRTVWDQINSFDMGKIQEFLKSQPAEEMVLI